MDVGAALSVAAVLLLVLANGFFVATEFAIVAVRRSRIEELASQGSGAARDARAVVGALDSYIAATQLGITLASLALGWIGEPALAHLIEPPLERLIGESAYLAADALGVAIAFALITALHIVVGELAPKGLALQRPEATTLMVARPIRLFYALFRWPIVLLNGLGNATLRVIGLAPATGHELVHSVEELRLLVTSSQQAGVVEESEARIAQRAFRFADLSASALMTPRTDLEAVPLEIDRERLLEQVRAGRHSRLVVYDQTLDDVVGALRVRDLFAALDQEPFDLAPLVRPVLTVPATKPADDLLEEMRAARLPVAVVLDEFGGTAGIVTLEDLVEALIGPVADEWPAADAAPAEAVEPDGSRLLDGLTRLDELEELADIQLGQAAHQAVETVGGLVMSVLGRIAREGDEIEVAGRRLVVERVDGRRVDLVRLLPPRNDSGAPAGLSSE